MSAVSESGEFDLYREGPTPIFLTIQVLLFFVGLDVAFRFRGFERVRAWVMRRSEKRPRRQPDPAMDEFVARTYRAVVAATAAYYRQQKDCLPRALAIFHFLRSKGVPVDFRLGIKKFPVAAHAWVEYRGQVVDISPDIAPRYIKMETVGKIGRKEDE